MISSIKLKKRAFIHFYVFHLKNQIKQNIHSLLLIHNVTTTALKESDDKTYFKYIKSKKTYMIWSVLSGISSDIIL